MNKATVIALAALLASNAAAKEIDETLDADANGRVIVSNIAGSVDVAGWDRNQVQVTGELGEDVDKFIFERDGREIVIKVKAPENGKRSWGRKDIASDLTVRVPRGSSLEVATVSADIDVEGVRGEQDLQAVSGDIRTEAFTADVNAATVSGDVDIDGDNKDGEWDLSSVSGDITATNLGGDVDAEVVSGDIEVAGGAYERVQLETVNGDIVFRAGLRKGGKLEAESVNGSVDLLFSGDVSARFDVESFNGRIKNCFGPKPKRADRYAPGWELSFSEGGGEGRVTVETLNGSIDICKD